MSTTEETNIQEETPEHLVHELEASTVPTQLGFQWGIIGSLIIIFYAVVRYLIGPKVYLNGFLVFSNYAFILLFMGIALIRVWNMQNKFVLFKQALKTTFLVSTLTIILTGAFGMLMLKVIDPNLIKYQKAQTIETTVKIMQWAGASEEDIDMTLERMENDSYDPSVLQMTLGFAFQIIIGFGFALAMSLVPYFKYKDKPPVKMFT